jgi:hypothetical protein
MLPGIPAALFMAVTKTLPKARSARGRAGDRMRGKKITGMAAMFVRSSRAERERSDDMPVMANRWRVLQESIF